MCTSLCFDNQVLNKVILFFNNRFSYFTKVWIWDKYINGICKTAKVKDIIKKII